MIAADEQYRLLNKEIKRTTKNNQKETTQKKLTEKGKNKIKKKEGKKSSGSWQVL